MNPLQPVVDVVGARVNVWLPRDYMVRAFVACVVAPWLVRDYR